MHLADIIRELKQLRQKQGGHVKDLKQKELEDLDKEKDMIENKKNQIREQMRRIDGDMGYSLDKEKQRLQERVNNSDYLANKLQKKTDFYKDMTEK
jgi:predicted  nucleic acid-binding Zn-ribbon protein